MSLPDRLRTARQAARLTQGAVGAKLDPKHTRKKRVQVGARANGAEPAHGRAASRSAQRVSVLACVGVRPCQVSLARFVARASTAKSGATAYGMAIAGKATTSKQSQLPNYPMTRGPTCRRG